MSTISQETAARIWTAHREIQQARKLLRDIAGENPLDAPNPDRPKGVGRRFDLSVPHLGAQRMLDVDGGLAAVMVQAHLVAKRQELIDATEAARREIESKDTPLDTDIAEADQALLVTAAQPRSTP